MESRASTPCRARNRLNSGLFFGESESQGATQPHSWEFSLRKDPVGSTTSQRMANRHSSGEELSAEMRPIQSSQQLGTATVTGILQASGLCRCRSPRAEQAEPS